MKRKSNVLRPNKVAYHYQRTLEARSHKKIPYSLNDQHYKDLFKLAVHGTTDVLAKGCANSLYRIVSKNHPTDFGYTKKVYILSDYGKRVLINKHRHNEKHN